MPKKPHDPSPSLSLIAADDEGAVIAPTAPSESAPVDPAESAPIDDRPDWAKRVEKHEALRRRRFKVVAPWLVNQLPAGLRQEITAADLERRNHSVERLVQTGCIKPIG
jgi:hypothetical protein